MALRYNNNSPEIINYNANNLDVVKYNGTIVWPDGAPQTSGVTVRAEGSSAFTTITHEGTQLAPSTSGITYSIPFGDVIKIVCSAFSQDEWPSHSIQLNGTTVVSGGGNETIRYDLLVNAETITISIDTGSGSGVSIHTH